MTDRSRATRSDFAVFEPIETRWADNDAYGHVNNVVYYAFFDTAVNRRLARAGLLDITGGEMIGLVVETGCRYNASAAFPDALEAGLKVARIGTSSVRYELAIFRPGEDAAIAEGFFVHVYVDRQTRRPTPLPDAWRAVLNEWVLKA
ncbi:acyl-CoA thioesterase [Alkalicaulis satelles]|uniref:Acyl-CoA thioesterase n=1 Tax=Alkalicaulis satelles TaxID=2609175 RepID=A0A5M6ZIP0_9PROT|nr:thioesterase family protein [Alkalicaulis satelles]KAA5803634.1 acyl-CoA thioesterase [Alkalicaulis satelles]